VEGPGDGHGPVVQPDLLAPTHYDGLLRGIVTPIRRILGPPLEVVPARGVQVAPLVEEADAPGPPGRSDEEALIARYRTYTLPYCLVD
jgi:hypothetical protein